MRKISCDPGFSTIYLFDCTFDIESAYIYTVALGVRTVKDFTLRYVS